MILLADSAAQAASDSSSLPTFEAEQLAIARDQAAAAWAAADAAWVQAWATPIGVAVALLAAVGVPYIQRWNERRGLKRLAANTASEAAGAVILLSGVSLQERLWGEKQDRSALYVRLDAAIARVDSFPNWQLRDPAIDTEFRLLRLELDSAKSLIDVLADSIEHKLQREALTALLAEKAINADQRRHRIWQLAGVSKRELHKHQPATVVGGGGINLG